MPKLDGAASIGVVGPVLLGIKPGLNSFNKVESRHTVLGIGNDRKPQKEGRTTLPPSPGVTVTDGAARGVMVFEPRSSGQPA